MKLSRRFKRIAAAAAGSVLAMLSLSGCGAGNTAVSEGEALSYGTGVILEVTDTGVYFASEGIGSATFVSFNGISWEDEEGNAVETSSLTPGQQIRYNCTSVLETWPAQLSGCTDVTVTGETEDVTALLEEWNKAVSDLASETGSEDDLGMPSLQLIQEKNGAFSCYIPLKGTSSWHTEEGGAGKAVTQCSSHPLDWEDEHLISVRSGKTELSFTASQTPDSVTVTRWDISARGDSTAEGEEVYLDSANNLSLIAGSVYEVKACWDDETTGGEVSWGFMAD